MRSAVIAVLVVVGCAAPRPATTVRPDALLSPLRIAEAMSDSIGFFGVDFSAAIGAAPTMVTHWKRVERSVGAAVLERSGYHAKRVPDDLTQMEGYAGARFLIAGQVLSLTTPSSDSSVAMTIQWRVFDAGAHLTAIRATADARVIQAGDADAAVEAAVASALSDFLGRDSVRSVLRPAPVTATTTNWRRSIPQAEAVIELRASDLNIAAGRSPLERSLPGVVSLRGSAGIGSAFVIARDGLAITNFHVVQNQRGLTASFRNGGSAAVRVVRTDSTNDLALIEVSCPNDCYTVDLYSGVPPLGADVFAIGSPIAEQLSHTVTKGIVSAVRQHGSERLIQTDAALNPGNSGGPLVDGQTARVVGVVSHKLMVDGTQGIGFAILLDDALRLLYVHRASPP